MPHTTAPNLDGLVQLSRREGVDIRPALLRVLTDLYVQEKSHTREQEQQYIELALRLLPAVDVPTRAAVASKLASCPVAPAPIVEQLAGDVAEVARAMLGRPAFPTEPTPEPREERGVATTPEAAPPLFASPAGDRKAREVRPSSGNALGETFLQADSTARWRLLAELDAKPGSTAGADSPAVNPELVRRLEQAALGRDQREFARELQHALRLSRETALRIARDPSGEPLLVVAWALAMPAPVLQRILLFLNPVIGESVERVFSLNHLYEGLSHRAAMPIVASWREEVTRRAGFRYVGQHADEAGTSGRALMDKARRAIAGRSGEPARGVEPSRARGSNQRTS